MVDQIDPTTSRPPPVLPSAGQTGFGGRQSQAEDRGPRKPIVDVASVLSLPASVISDELQDQFLLLVEEVERLRDEVERARLHEAYLSQAADSHAMLPALNRRAFLKGLGRILDSSERADLSGSLVLLRAEGLEAVRAEWGIFAGDAALSVIASTLRTDLRQTDLLGYLDGGDFAIALAVARPSDVDSKISAILAQLATPILWQGQVMQITFRLGRVDFPPSAGAEQLLAAADLALRADCAPVKTLSPPR